MKQVLFVFLFLFIHLSVLSQNLYNTSLIPFELRTRANAVIRNQETTITANKLDEVKTEVREAITVLNKNGDETAALDINYSKNKKIKSLKASLYDEYGALIRKIASSEFKDESAVSGYSIFEDSRRKIFHPASTTYPYTIVYEYEIQQKESLILPEWYPYFSSGTSVENASLVFVCTPDFNIRFKEFNMPQKGEVTINQKGEKTYSWKIRHLKALREEPFSSGFDKFMPSVKIAPQKFQYGSYKGSFTNWQEYGKWMYDNLLEGRDEIPAASADYIKKLVQEVPDLKQRAKKIYEFVQNKTRYVSVQIGIGGFQPMTAAEVDQLSYGDCKALVNYTKGLLKTVGIESYYVLVEAGSRKTDAIEDFASINQFNHAILCIPFPQDTAWVDCTSKTLPFGFLGYFTDDRLALAITPQGGKLVRTPESPATENEQTRKGNFEINEKGDLSGEMITEFKGAQYQNREELIEEPFAEQQKILAETYPLNNLQIVSYNLHQEKKVKPVTLETIKLKAVDYGAINTTGMILRLNPFNQSHPIKEFTNRLTPVYINRGYTDKDEIYFTLPPQYTLDSKPNTVILEKPFGKYSAIIEVKDKKVAYRREILIKEGTYSSEVYPELVDFFQKVADADEVKILLKRVD